MKRGDAGKKMAAGVIVIFLLAIALTLTTFALVYETVRVENNIFRTGLVKINLNDGEPVIREDEFLMEPGMTVVKTFFVENLSTWDVYYRIYFENVSGDLADVLIVGIYDGDTLLEEGTMRELTRSAVVSAPDPLQVMEKKTLTVRFLFPEDRGNLFQEQKMSFDMCAEAVQTKNNPDKAFG